MASTTKTLKVLILLDQRGWITASHIGKRLDMTPHEVASHLRILQRVGLVDNRPRQRINGTRRAAIYCSIRKRLVEQ